MPPMDPQPALQHGPGRFRALLTFDAPHSLDATMAVATLLKELELPALADKPLKILVAMKVSLLEGHPAHPSLMQEHVDLYDDQADVLVQIAAETEDDRTYARRLVKRVLGTTTVFRQEYSAGRHILSREPFGYQERTPEPEVVPMSAAAPGVSWLLYQRCEQDVAAFYANLPTEREQDSVVGHGRNHNPEMESDIPAPGSHIDVARRTGKGLLRRSFGHTTYDQDNLLFIAAAAHPREFTLALDAFKRLDPLARHVTLREGGLFVVPPSSSWLAPSADLPALGDERPASEQPFYPSRPLVLYDMTPSTRDFFFRLFHDHKENFDERGALREDIKLLTRGFTKLVYGWRLQPTSLLFRLLDRAFAADTSKVVFEQQRGGDVDAAIESLASKRITFDGAKRDIEAQRRSLGDEAANARLATLEAEFFSQTAGLRATVQKHLQARAKLGLADAGLSQATIESLYVEIMSEDAENMHARSAAVLEEIDHIAALCEKAAGEGRALNDVAGKYMTLIC